MIPVSRSTVRTSVLRSALIVGCLCIPLAACQSNKAAPAKESTKSAPAPAKAAAATPARTSGTLYMDKKIPYAKGLNVPLAIKAECQLDEKVPEFVQSYAKDDYSKIDLAGKASTKSSGRVLVMQITDISNLGGGAWTGPKFVTIEGTLWQDGKVAGNFRGTRYSSGGAWGGYKGTCAILGRCAKALGKDVADWMNNPTKDALLGDAKKK